MKSPCEGRNEHGVLVAFAGPPDTGGPEGHRWVVRVVRAG